MVRIGNVAKWVAVAAALIVGCGGHKAADTDTTPTGGGIDTTPHPAHDDSANMIPPEKMDEVSRALSRKQMLMAHCLASAMETKEVQKNAKGKVTLEIVVGTSGKADSVKLIHSDFEAKSVTDCVIRHVQETGFPELPKAYETSYTYPLEAN